MIDITKYKRKLVSDYVPKRPGYISNRDRCAGDQTRLTPRQAAWLRKNYADCTDADLAMALWCEEGMIQRYARNNALNKSAKFQRWAKTNDPTMPVPTPRQHYETDEELAERIRAESKADSIIASSVADTFDFCNQSEKKALTHILFEALRWGREH